MKKKLCGLILRGSVTKQNKIKPKKTAIHLLKLGKMFLEDIAKATELPLDTIKELA